MKTESPGSWIMAPDFIEKVRESAISNFQREESRRYYETLLTRRLDAKPPCIET